MMGAKIFGFELATDFKYRAIHLTGVASNWGAGVCAILSIMVYVILTIYLARRMRAHRDTPECGLWLIKGLLASILAMLATSKVFLPQYLLWASPLAVLLAYDHRPGVSRAGRHLFSVNLISAVVFFFFYF